MMLRLALLGTWVLCGIVCMVMGAKLSKDFYSDTCPDVGDIVTRSIAASAARSNVVAPSILRLFFHDALVQGCDASILISSTADNEAERDYVENKSLRQEGFDAIERAKHDVESACPGVVSCADILALAARDVVVFSGGPSWEVFLGRKDGLISSSKLVEGRIPQANSDLRQLYQLFSSLGLSITDLVLLSGAHTIGFSHCDQFMGRLYSFNSPGSSDPSLDPDLLASLKQECPMEGGDPSTVVAFDEKSPFTFDNNYYRDLQSGRGLLFSDQVLFNDETTRGVVNQLASSPDQTLFFDNFVISMVALGNVTSDLPGNVRQVCSRFNQ
ncbi:hypothetical protein KP509_39G060700 [Ceratopteris richardii]|uniref:Peroxidase n=1 Tax=Ceratopteris richardii TaxID=49495 RepID=A0A8T2Q1K4_CERRI|nr:hypothetical protein KP509_39G060700 [Ceratopteris richardii]